MPCLMTVSGIRLKIGEWATQQNLSVKSMKSHVRSDGSLVIWSRQSKGSGGAGIGKFKDEIIPVEIVGRKGEVTVVDTDEGPRKDTSLVGFVKT